MLKFCSIASGSSGNCYYIESEETAILVDVGVAGKRIEDALGEIDVALEKIEYVFLTHEHIDHVKSVGVMVKKLPNAKFYATCGTWECIEESKLAPERRNIIKAGQSIEASDLKVSAFELSHDAKEPVGYKFRSKNAGIAIVTDTGEITEKCKKALYDVEMLVLEANYEKELLMVSPRYPWQLKQRIMGERGHLSNSAAADIVEGIVAKGKDCKLKTLVLAHLSKETNYPQLAYKTLEGRLAEICTDGQKIHLGVAKREERSEVYIIR